MGNTASSEEVLKWLRAVGNTLSDLTGCKFDFQLFIPYVNALPLDQLAGEIYLYEVIAIKYRDEKIGF